MTLKLHNTLSRRLEVFKPIDEGMVRMYTCGPTVYDTAHIGNFRTFIFEDLLKRYLLYKGYKVRHVMNITDFDDRTIERAAQEGVTRKTITQKYTKEFFQHFYDLNIMRPTQFTIASNWVKNYMIPKIEKLIQLGHAYKTNDGSVYFKIAKFPEYGKLKHLDPDQFRKGERVIDDTYDKLEARDFALWKAYSKKDRDTHWMPSKQISFGKGRPGWHLECSIMSVQTLGKDIDIHCGGVDNIFPHHENEIAQSKCIYGGEFVRHWVHSEHLIVDGRKMSKSSGNYFTLQDLLNKRISPEAVRYALISTHYRKKLNFTFDRLYQSQKTINRLRELVRRLKEVDSLPKRGHKLPDTQVPPDDAVKAALDDDLNISMALGAIFNWAHKLFGLHARDMLSSDVANTALEALHRYDGILGVIFHSPTGVDDEVADLIAQREAARRAEDWVGADEIRDKLLKRGILLEDTATGTVWKRD